MMNSRNILGMVVALYTALSVAAFAQEAIPRPAKVVTLQSTEETVLRRYPATVLPSREIELSFKVSGQVIELPIRAASQVAAGDVVARIDPRDFENQILQLQSQRAQAEAQLDALRAGAREEEIIALEAAVASAQAQVDQTREALTRAAQLLERGVSTRALLEAAQSEFAWQRRICGLRKSNYVSVRLVDAPKTSSRLKLGLRL